ncbi:MAG: phage tail tape measure protein [Butyrivibrio sp.]|nr:phage tail tape measure protein [Butyrivibrio sp.]
MPYNMGEAVGKVSLDTSGVTEGAQKASDALKDIGTATESSSEAMDQYAQSLGKVAAEIGIRLASAIEQQGKAIQRVAELQEELTEAQERATRGQGNYQKYSGAVANSALKVYEKATADIARIEKELVVAQQQEAVATQAVIKAREDYAATIASTAQKAAQAETNANAQVEQTKIREAEKTARHKLEVATANATKIAEAEVRANAQAQAKVEKAKIDAAQKATTSELAIRTKAQTDIERAEIAAQNRIEQTKIREAEKSARALAQTKLREEEKTNREIEKAAAESANRVSEAQAVAFAVTAKAVNDVIEGVKRLTQEMVNLGKQIIETGASFEQSMAQVAATSGMTATEVQKGIGEYNALVESARTAGETTMFTATQAGEALNYLALAGYSVQESIDTMPDILTIAAAGAMDLGTASDMVTDAMNALELSVGETSDFIDKMAKTAQSSNTNVEQLGRAILTVGGTATVLKGGVAELDTALGLMANSGIKAQQGGTSLRQILLNLTDPTKKAAKKMEELGLQVFDTEGNMRSLQDIFSDLDTIMADFSDQERMEALGEIFNARHIRAAVALMNSTGEAWDELADKIDNADGAANRMADTMMSTFKGAIITAKSTLESIQITLYEGVQRTITDLVNEAIPKLRELNKELGSPEVQSRLESMSAQLKAIALDLLDGVIKALPKVIDFLSRVNAHLQNFITIAGTLIGLKLALEAEKVATALVGLFSIIAAHPVFALVAAVSALVVVVRELHAAAQAEHEATIAAIRAETDAYAEQRAEIEGTIDSWNDYKETADEVMNNATEQKDKVQALYEGYKKLHEAGEDTTLAMQALADEIPELKTMLADGKDSFEDITGAVDDYCEALIRSAQLEAGKEMYSEASKAVYKLTKQVDDQKKAVEESEKAYREAQREREDFERTHDVSFFTRHSVFYKEQNEEYDLLISKEKALRDIYLENTAAYGASSDALSDALEEKERAEANCTAAMRTETNSRLSMGEAEVEAHRAAGQEIARTVKEAYTGLKEVSEEETNAFLASMDGFDNQIKLREKTDADKFNFARDWFSQSNWDKTNQDLINWYDKLLTYDEKNAEALKTQQDKEAKKRQNEQDKANKEAQAAADKADKEWTDRINKAIKKTEKRAKREEWDDSDLLAFYKKFLENNANYYEKHLDKKEEFEEKIADLDDQINDKHIAAAKAAAKKYVNAWTEGYDKLVDSAVKAYDDIEKAADKYQDSLLKGVDLIGTESKKVWDTSKQALVEKDVSVVSAKSLKEDLAELKEFNAFVESLRKQGANENLIDEIMGMSADKRTEFMTAFNKMSAGEKAEYLATYQQIQDEAATITEDYFATELQKWQDEYWTPVQKYAETGGKELKDAMKTAGVDSVQGWLDGVQEKHDEATGQTKAMYEEVLQKAKDALGIASPSKEFYSIGEFSIQGFLDGLRSKIESITTIFTNLGQRAGDAFTAAFQSTWDSFVTLLNTTGGLQVPVAMTTTAFGTPVVQGAQVAYSGSTPTSYVGLTKADVVSAIEEAMPSGDVVLSVDSIQFGRVSRQSLNMLAKESGKLNIHN